MSAPSQIIYLASKSPRRRELLKQIGVHYELLMMRELAPRVDIDESPRANEDPRAYVERVVRLKADTARNMMVTRKLPSRLILTADTTVALFNDILGKPKDVADAMRTLRTLSGHTHEVLTGIAVTAGNETHFAVSTSRVTFAVLSDADIKRYVDTGEPMDKAGAYGIQGHAAKFISEIQGSYSGVMGLPLHETAELLKKAGLAV
jgi:septum formation protein